MLKRKIDCLKSSAPMTLELVASAPAALPISMFCSDSNNWSNLCATAL
ncbi:MAG: hypothetical protein ACFFBV_03565 [Promethearchaeota archaeon]